MSKIESGKIEITENPTSILEIVETTADMFSAASAAKGLELLTYVDPNIEAQLFADKTRIAQILTNFTSNAIKYSKKGFILVQAQVMEDCEDTQTIAFSCTDTGVGIRAENLQKLFKPFSQIQDGEYEAKGYGLGLSICERLAAMMKGTVHVESEYGKGSCFKLVLPLRKMEPVKRACLRDRYSPSMYKAAILVTDSIPLQLVLPKYLTDIYVLDIDCTVDLQECYQRMRDCESYGDMLLVIVDDMHLPKFDFDQVQGDVKVLLLLGKSINTDGKLPESPLIDSVKKPVKITRLMNACSGRRSSMMTSSLLWDKGVHIRLEDDIDLLCVEDNPINLKAIMRLLHHVGIKNIDSASNGQEALEKIHARQKPYSIILMDLTMPVMVSPFVFGVY